MKENLYEKIKKDIKKYDDDVFISDNLSEIIETYNVLVLSYKDKVNEEDLFILLKEKYKEIINYDSKLYSKLIAKIKEYFDDNKKDINFEYNKLNCGIIIEELPSKLNQLKKKTNEYNGVARTLRIIGILEIVLGTLLGLATLFANSENSFLVFMIIFITSFVSGMIFVGFSEIIQILHDIRKKQ